MSTWVEYYVYVHARILKKKSLPHKSQTHMLTTHIHNLMTHVCVVGTLKSMSHTNILNHIHIGTDSKLIYLNLLIIITMWTCTNRRFLTHAIGHHLWKKHNGNLLLTYELAYIYVHIYCYYIYTYICVCICLHICVCVCVERKRSV